MSENKVGRPTDYGPEVLDLAREYIQDWEQLGDKVPMRAGLAIHIGVSKRTVTRWAADEEKEEFCRLVELIDAMQEKKLANCGLSNEFNSKITGLMMAKHGYSEKHEVSGPDGGPVQSQYIINPVKPKEDADGDQET